MSSLQGSINRRLGPVGNPYVILAAQYRSRRHLPNSTTTYLTIAEVEAQSKTRAPWRQADPSRPAQDGGALLHLRAQPALKPKKDFLPYAGNPRRHSAVHCTTRVLWRRPRAPSVLRCAAPSFEGRCAGIRCPQETRPRPALGFAESDSEPRSTARCGSLSRKYSSPSFPLCRDRKPTGSREFWAQKSQSPRTQILLLSQ